MQPQKWQRNAVIEAVEEGGLDRREFTFDFGDSESRIAHVPSGSSFLLQGGPGEYNSTIIVGDGFPFGPLPHYTWSAVEERISRWAGDVKRDVETPDLWAELQREREVLTGGAGDDTENAPFSPDEQAEIAKRFRQIKEYVRETYELTPDQYATIDKRLADLEDAARRGVGRFDWRNQLIGVLLGLAIDAVLPPEPVQQVLIITLRGLAQLFGVDGVPELPGAPPELT